MALNRVSVAALSTSLRSVRSMATAASAVTFSRFGDPSAVLKSESVSLDDPAGDSVLVRMMAASVSPTDLGHVRGFGATSAVPAVAGNEGVGVVEKAGPGASGFKAGDVVVPQRAGVGTWATHTVAPAGSLFKVASSTDGLPLEQLAALAAPLTAMTLVDGAGLSAGDVIVQNNAGSAVGQAVVQYAASKGLKTVNIMRHRDDWDDVVNHLQGLGAHIVVTDEFAQTPEFTALLSDLPSPKLGLTSVGGSSTASVGRALGSGASLVVYGNVSRKPFSLSLDVLVSKGVTVSGFNLDRHMASLSDADRAKAMGAAVDLATGRKVEVLLATEPFADFDAALARAVAAGERKVVLKM